MKESDVLQNLEEIAQELKIKIYKVNLKKYSSYSIKGGLCRVKEEHRIIVDKNLHLSEKIDVIIEALQKFDLASVTINPYVKRLFGGSVTGKEPCLQKADQS
jgi:hypothetical protein